MGKWLAEETTHCFTVRPFDIIDRYYYYFYFFCFMEGYSIYIGMASTQ